MSMQDLAGALQGGGPDPYGGGGGAPGAPPGEDEPAGQETAEQNQYQTSLDALDGAEEALHAFIQLDPDDGDRAVAATCLQNILKLKAKNQQQTQGSGGMTSLARALQGTTGQ
jgi:hypothetical protein